MKPGSGSGPASEEDRDHGRRRRAGRFCRCPATTAVRHLTRTTPQKFARRVLGRAARCHRQDPGRPAQSFGQEQDSKPRSEGWSKGRGDWLTAGPSLGRNSSRAAIVRGAVTDPERARAKRDRNSSSCSASPPSQPPSPPGFGDMKFSGPGPGKTWRTAPAQTVHVVRRPPPGSQLRRERRQGPPRAMSSTSFGRSTREIFRGRRRAGTPKRAYESPARGSRGARSSAWRRRSLERPSPRTAALKTAIDGLGRERFIRAGHRPPPGSA